MYIVQWIAKKAFGSLCEEVRLICDLKQGRDPVSFSNHWVDGDGVDPEDFLHLFLFFCEVPEVLLFYLKGSKARLGPLNTTHSSIAQQ